MAPHSPALFSLLKAYKLLLVLPLCPLHFCLSSLTQSKQSRVLSYHGQSLEGLLYFLGQIFLLSPCGENEGIAGHVRVKGGCKLSCPEKRVAKTNCFCDSEVEGYMEKNFNLSFPCCWYS